MTITVDQLTQPVNLVWRQGDSQPQTFRLLSGPGQPWDLTNVYVKSSARSTLGQTTDLTVGVDDPTGGVLTIHPPLAGLEPDVYDYDVQFNDGQRTATWIHGRIQVKPEVTR